jgi:hypothetical protein
MFQDVQSANRWRSVLLLTVAFVLLVVVGEAVSYYFQAGPFGLVVALLIAVVSTSNAYWNSDKVALHITGAHQVDDAATREAPKVQF